MATTDVNSAEPNSEKQIANEMTSDEWALIDTETDGLYSPIHVIEIAAQKFRGLDPVGTPFRVFINHGVQIPSAATAVHGYTTEFIRENGISPQEAYQLFRVFAGDMKLVSHMLGFDYDRALNPELQRLGLPSIGSRGFCSCLLSRRALPEHTSHRLDYLREAYALRCCRPHSALGDVESVVDLLTRVVFPRLGKVGISDIQAIEGFSRMAPLLRCKCIVQGLSYELEAAKVAQTRKEKKRMAEFLIDVECGEYPMPDLIINFDLIEDKPDIQFQGCLFLFTGKLAWGKRKQAEEQIQSRGGLVCNSKTVSAEVDYLVLGEDREAGWNSLLNGGKLTHAFLKRLRTPDMKLRIIREQDFVSAISS